MRLSELTWQPVITRGDAAELGRIANFVIDPSEARVCSYRLEGSNRLLPISAATAVGPDAVVVQDGTELHEPRSLVEQRAVEHDLQVLGARVLTDAGEELGRLHELQFDESTGMIEELDVQGRPVAGSELLGVGTHAVVVHEAD
jgi:sporulation protein YlmC with PRC-barrel domain